MEALAAPPLQGSEQPLQQMQQVFRRRCWTAAGIICLATGADALLRQRGLAAAVGPLCIAAWFALAALSARWVTRERRQGFLWTSAVLLPPSVALIATLRSASPDLTLAAFTLFPAGASTLLPDDTRVVTLLGLSGLPSGLVLLADTGLPWPFALLWLAAASTVLLLSVFATVRYRRLQSLAGKELERGTQQLTTALASGRFLQLRDEDEVIHLAAEILGGHGFKVCVMRAVGGELALSHHGPESRLGRWIERATGTPARALRFPVVPELEKAIATRRPLIDADLRPVLERAMPRWVAAWVAAALQGRSMDMPLFVEGEFYGLLSVRGDSLTAGRAVVLELFARLVEVALENVRAHRAVAERVERLKQLEQELLSRERLATLGEVTALVAHEVRRPLEGISEAAQRLAGEPLPSHGASVLTMVREESARLHGLVADLLLLASPLEPTLQPVDLGEVAQRSVQSVRTQEGAAAVELSLDQEPAPLVEGDVGHLQVVVENLVRNAVQASPPSGRVTVRVSPHPQGACLSVEDEGPGVAPEDRLRIFEPFFTTRVSGTGLGLSIVRRIVEALGGTIRVGESPSGGARFELVLGEARR